MRVHVHEHLRGELLGGEAEGGDELLSEGLGLVEAEGEEADLSNQSVVGHHHRHRSELWGREGGEG